MTAAIRETLDELAAMVESLEARQEPRLRLLMNPSNAHNKTDRTFGTYRFVRESNGHPGNCVRKHDDGTTTEDCWHYSVSSALAHFEGRTT